MSVNIYTLRRVCLLPIRAAAIRKRNVQFSSHGVQPELAWNVLRVSSCCALLCSDQS